jgi:hypothetical protein
MRTGSFVARPVACAAAVIAVPTGASSLAALPIASSTMSDS